MNESINHTYVFKLLVLPFSLLFHYSAKSIVFYKEKNIYFIIIQIKLLLFVRTHCNFFGERLNCILLFNTFKITTPRLAWKLWKSDPFPRLRRANDVVEQVVSVQGFATVCIRRTLFKVWMKIRYRKFSVVTWEVCIYFIFIGNIFVIGKIFAGNSFRQIVSLPLLKYLSQIFADAKICVPFFWQNVFLVNGSLFVQLLPLAYFCRN